MVASSSAAAAVAREPYHASATTTGGAPVAAPPAVVSCGDRVLRQAFSISTKGPSLVPKYYTIPCNEEAKVQ